MEFTYMTDQMWIAYNIGVMVGIIAYIVLPFLIASLLQIVGLVVTYIVLVKLNIISTPIYTRVGASVRITSLTW